MSLRDGQRIGSRLASFIASSTGKPAWAGCAAATVLMLGLLLAFQHVVQAGVAQGELRREATRMRTDALWRCRTLANRGARARCLARLDEAPSLPAAADMVFAAQRPPAN
jgi:hypothetical protein